MKTDIYQTVTNQIIAALEKGKRPWIKPWDASTTIPKRATGEAYRGANIILLWLAELLGGYTHTQYMTFKQAKELGGFVKKGEKGHLVIKYGTFTPKDRSESEEEKQIPYVKGYTVFNVEQIENLPEKFYQPATIENISPEQRIEKLEAFVKCTGATIRHFGHSAAYSSATDIVAMPAFECFHSPEAYYSTLFHELGHWTGAKHRLDRKFSTKTGNTDYAFEELIAELTACFVGATVGLNIEFENSVSYVQSWLAGLKNDKRFFFQACSKAQAAADYLLASYKFVEAAA